MIDLEQKLNEDGFSDFDQQIDGTFDEQGHPEIRWHAEILKPDSPRRPIRSPSSSPGPWGAARAGGSTGDGDQPPAALADRAASLVPAGTPARPSGLDRIQRPSHRPSPGLGGALGGRDGGLIQMQVTQLVHADPERVREVRLTVTWPDGNKEDSLSVATHFVVLQPTGRVSTGTPGQGSGPEHRHAGGASRGPPGRHRHPLGSLGDARWGSAS